MKKETINNDIHKATLALFEMARTECYNKIVANCIYYLSTESEYLNVRPFELIKERVFKNKRLFTLEKIVKELEKNYDNLYDVNLYILKATKKRTIVEIRCFLKSEYEGYNPAIQDNSLPMLHAKIGIPPYIDSLDKSKKEKYDVNWQLGGFKHWWKLFWWRQKMKKPQMF